MNVHIFQKERELTVVEGVNFHDEMFSDSQEKLQLLVHLSFLHLKRRKFQQGIAKKPQLILNILMEMY